NLELHFARETGESVVRFQYGLRDTVAGSPRGGLTARIRAPGPMFGARVLLGPSASAAGMGVLYLPQVAVANKRSDEWQWYLPEELNMEILGKLSPGSRVQYFFSSPEQEQLLRGRLRELGLGATKHLGRETIPPQPEMAARVTYLFNEIIRRCVAKIAFNYL